MDPLILSASLGIVFLVMILTEAVFLAEVVVARATLLVGTEVLGMLKLPLTPSATGTLRKRVTQYAKAMIRELQKGRMWI